MRRRFPALGVWAVAFVFLTGCSGSPNDGLQAYPDKATETYPDGTSNSQFTTPAELVATAAFSVKGSVDRVEQGEPVRMVDGTGEVITPRIIVVAVDDVIHVRAEKSAPSFLRVVDGYWLDGKGYERESIGWLTEGERGYFFVSQDIGPDGARLETFSPLTGSGIARVGDGGVEFAAGEPWGSPEPGVSDEDFRKEVDAAARDVETGEVEPIPQVVCHPSKPGDENSEPVCVEL